MFLPILASIANFTAASLVFHLSISRLLVTANVAPSSTILFILMMEALRSSETLVLTTATRRNTQKTAFFIVIAVKTSNLT
jgi:hypothetical protein